MKVMIVDDSLLISTRLRGLLSKSENVGALSDAADVEEGKKVFAKENPDVVLLDINLPGENGLGLLDHIRMTGGETKVIMMTNENGRFYRQWSIARGADYFVDKSNDFDLLPGILSDLCRSDC